MSRLHAYFSYYPKLKSSGNSGEKSISKALVFTIDVQGCIARNCVYRQPITTLDLPILTQLNLNLNYNKHLSLEKPT